MVANLVVGETAKVTAVRDGREKTVAVEISQRPSTVAAFGSVREKKGGKLPFSDG